MDAKKQTAVEWLQEPLENILTHEQQMQVIGLFHQAKAMEKEQIKDAFEQGENNSVDYFVPEHRIKESAQYYNETYGQ